MASNIYISNYLATGEANAINAANYLSGATLTIYSGLQPNDANTALSGQTALASFTLPVYTSNTVSNNLITFGAIASATASNTGTAAFFRITNGANVICDGSVGTAGCDLNINSTGISSGGTVSISSFTFTITE